MDNDFFLLIISKKKRSGTSPTSVDKLRSNESAEVFFRYGKGKNKGLIIK